jgi:RAB protein geranylgeranyltransferase component A
MSPCYLPALQCLTYSVILSRALSRSGKKVLHVDRNGYYGGAEAALSLAETETWVQDTGDSTFQPQSAASFQGSPSLSGSTVFQHVSSRRLEAGQDGSSMGPSRTYSLSLAPQLVYTKSRLLKHLVSSKVYRQLEFLAMGSWWVYSPPATDSDPLSTRGTMTRVPANREDVAFSDTSIDIRAKRSVMKILRFVAEYENQPEVWESHRSKPLVDFLVQEFKLPAKLTGIFLALTLAQETPDKVTTEFALPRIARHLRSTGKLGPGFSAVIPKWGGLAEIVQVGCRAAAVGGAIYVLGNGIVDVHASPDSTDSPEDSSPLDVRLSSGETVKAKNIVGSIDDLPDTNTSSLERSTCHTVSVVSSPLRSLFPTTQEGSPLPAGATVVVPSGSLQNDDSLPPVWLIVHSAETGECPPGKSKSIPNSLPPALCDDPTMNTYLHYL